MCIYAFWMPQKPLIVCIIGILCYKLLNCGVPKLIVRFLLTWYMTQQFAVKWCNIVSKPFSTTNGEGGILSPRLFSVYIDELSTLLNKSNIDCQ